MELSRSQERRIAVQKGENLTESEIKEKLFRLWAEKGKEANQHPESFKFTYKPLCKDKTISEIQTLMIGDGVDQAEINKIMESK